VLLEVANVKNSYDAANMDTAAFRSNVARRIVDGAINYFNLKEGKERPLSYCHRQKLGG
jgi:N-acetylmuramoyl-L-alanine amidase